MPTRLREYRGTVYSPDANPDRLYRSILYELRALPHAIEVQAGRRHREARIAYLTKVMGELQAIRAIIEDEDVPPADRKYEQTSLLQSSMGEGR